MGSVREGTGGLLSLLCEERVIYALSLLGQHNKPYPVPVTNTYELFPQGLSSGRRSPSLGASLL